jgi:branched-chain amino acid transport system ATP-binding protein
MNLLEISEATKSFGTLVALNGASISVEQNEIVGLIGPNGSGKSTLLHVICGRTYPDSGSIKLLGKELVHLPPVDRAKSGMAIKFQVARIYVEKTVRENLLLSLQSKDSIWSLLRSRSAKKFQPEIEKLLNEFQLQDYGDTKAKFLSHGQQQWLEIAMAMASNPTILLLDEPTAGMSPKERSDTAVLIKNASLRCGVLIVEHDLDFIKDLCDRITVLHHGTVVASGTPSFIQEHPMVKEVYLTRV